MLTRDFVLWMMKRASPEGVRAFRERRGWTHGQVADAVHATPLEVAAWEAGTVRVPQEQSRILRSLAEEDHVVAALAAAGVPPCEWAERNAPHLYRYLQHEPWSSLPDHELLHARECPDCARIQRFRRDLHVVPTDPGLGFDDPLLRLGRSLDALPRVALFPLLVTGGFALVVVAVVVLQPLFSLLSGLPSPPRGAEALGWGLAAGFLGFTLSAGFVRGLWRRPYAAGLLRALAAVVAGLLAAAGTDDRLGLFDPGVLAGGALLVLVLGVAAGAYARWRGDDEDLEDDAAPAEMAPGVDAPRLAEGAADAVPGRRAHRERVPVSAVNDEP